MLERTFHRAQRLFQVEVDGTEYHHSTHQAGGRPIDSSTFGHVPCSSSRVPVDVLYKARPDSEPGCDSVAVRGGPADFRRGWPRMSSHSPGASQIYLRRFEGRRAVEAVFNWTEELTPRANPLMWFASGGN